MKTYTSLWALLTLVIIGCSSSEEPLVIDEQPTSVDADYAVMLSSGTALSPQLLNANGELLTLNPVESGLSGTSMPLLTAFVGSEFLQYHKNGCSGRITLHDFATDVTEEIDVFDDLNDCMLTTTAMLGSSTTIAIAYEREIDGKNSSYGVRIIDRGNTELEFVDIPLNKKPMDLALANNRLFIMTLDLELSEENFLSVLDLSSNSLVHEMNLGFRARRVFSTAAGTVIISYDELHTTLDSSSLSFVFTNYAEGTEPEFTTNTFDRFDDKGKLYYPKRSSAVSSYPEIPAVYDFGKNLVTLYAYENFLTEAKRDVEFEIETTTTVNYDQKNDLIVIGYKKVGSQAGGLLRIKPSPEPAFVDHLDLDGVPYVLFIN